MLVHRSWRWLKRWVWALGDAMPPYHTVYGLLESKNKSSDAFYIRVSGVRVEVDGPTWNGLTIGDSLGVRLTRGARAVNIDQFVSEPGSDEDPPPS